MLSNAAIRNAKDKDVIWDEKIRGLHLRCFPNRKAFYLYYRTKDRRERRPKLGEWGPHGLSLEEARTIARKMMLAVADGRDPVSERRVAAAAPTMRDLWARYAKDSLPALKPSTQRNYRLSFDKYVIPALGPRRVADVTYDDIDHLRLRMQATPYMANRVVQMLQHAFNLAERWNWRPQNSNPCRHVSRYKEKKRKGYLPPEGIKRLFEAFDALEETYPDAVAALRLIALTGARKNEIVKAKWEWFDGARLNLPDSKTGEKTIHLPPQAVAILEGLDRRSPWIFPQKGGKGPRADLKHAWWTIRARAGLPTLRIHDLRHTFASVALAAGGGLDQVGALLGHSDTRTTKRYAELLDDPAREMARSAAELLTSWGSGE